MGKPRKGNVKEAGSSLKRKTALPSLVGATSTAAVSIPVVGVGASAGGLSAVTELLTHFPAKVGLAVVVIQHLDPKHGSLTAEILSRTSPMPVTEVKDGTPIQADHVYVIPPNSNLRLSGGVLRLSPRAASGQFLPIDFFFRSLADEKKNQAIGVVLSGIASDGTLGLLAIKSEGGRTFAQDPKSAQYEGMPRNAILAGAVNVVETPQRIAQEIARSSGQPVQEGASIAFEKKREPGGYFAAILSTLRNATGVDFPLYKPSTLRRRIARRQGFLKKPDPKDYLGYLRDHPEEVKSLFEDMLIQVTSFFRDPEAYERLKSHILPRYMADWNRNGPFRVWVPGCSTGEEAYSIAMVFSEFLDQTKVRPQLQIFASDISEQAIQKARAAIYSESITKDVSKARLRRFFEKAEGGYRIAKWLRDTCLFSRQDVTADPPFAKIDMISCRNVLIYFSPDLQKRVIPVFHYALNPGGILWLGRSETITGFSKLFTLEDKANKFYSKKSITSPLRLEFPAARHPADPVAPVRKSPGVITLEDVQREADRVAIQEYAPPGVVVNDTFDILQIRGRLAPFLGLTPGRASLNLFKLARPEIVADLRYLINLSQRENTPAKRDGLVLRQNGRQTSFGINVVPLPAVIQAKERCFSIFFEEASAAASEPASKRRKSAAADRPRQAAAQRQFAEERKYRQSLITDYENTQEELTASNEELQSANEELQSTNEELETAKEELQSANEEMTTVNDELQNRNADMSVLTSDLTNLISSVDIPIVMVGSDGRIRRFTPKAAQILRLIGNDVGRPIGDLNTGIEAVDLDELVSSVVASMTLREFEVQDRHGSWYRVQGRPYRTVDNKIDGAVIALFDITVLKHAADQLKKLGDDAVMIIETMPMPILVITSDRRVRVANHAFCKTFQVERSEMEGRSITELGAGEWSNPVLLKILEDVFIRDAQYKDFEMEIDFLHGRKSLILNVTSAFLSGLGIQAALLAIEDSTERNRIAGQLNTAEEMFRNLMENARDGIVVVNQKGTIEFANRRAEEMFGYSTGELTHQPYEHLIPDQSREVHRNHHAGYTRDPQPRDMGTRVELYARRKDGLVFPVDISLSPVKRNSDVLVTAIIRDISERKKTETERLKIMASEKEARLEAEKANRIKDEFLATLSHELRTPLTAILSWAQILRLGKGDPKKGLTMIEKSANDQSQLIDDLLDVSRIHAGKIHLNLSILNPADCVSLAVDSVRPFAEEKSQTIETVIDPSASQINADPARIQQVFRNLLTNAIKFTPVGGRITVRLNRLGNEDNERIQIQFSDTGKGIHVDFLPFLFARFTQAESSPTRGFGGLGLGLSIVKNLVEMHGGTVSAESPGEGKGSVFTVILPCNPAISRPGETIRKVESSRPATEVPDEPAKLNGLRMLIVDDVKETRDGFEAFFQSIGAQVRTAASAAQGFDSLPEFKPNVLLCDIAMPGEDGYSLIRRIRALKKDQGGRIPAIAVTAYAAAEDVHRALAAKYNRHVAKPADLVKLSHVIAKLVKREKR